MKKRKKYNEHLDHILERTTPYQRMLWLKKAFGFWKIIQLKNVKKQSLFK